MDWSGRVEIVVAGRRGRSEVALGAALLCQGLLLATAAGGQVLAGDMLYTSVQPCRVFDTRLQAAGALTANSARAFHVVGSSSDFVAQGGRSGGCDIPGFDNGAPRALAEMVNLVAVAPQGAGNLRAYAGVSVQIPQASVLNYANVPQLNIANGLVVPLRQDSEGSDLTLRADVAATHVVGDVVGFFSPAKARRYYLTDAEEYDGSEAMTACAEGFHMASLWEIFHFSTLEYDSTLGFDRPNSAPGPPAGVWGWIRTGGYTDPSSTEPGAADCDGWTSNTIVSGSVVQLGALWDTASTGVSPWLSGSPVCSNAFRVWCVED
jgi:hypothetical protein